MDITCWADASCRHDTCRARTRWETRMANRRTTKIGYAGAHDRVRKLRGRAADHLCQWCGKDAAYWAYDGRDKNEFRDQRGRYSLDVRRYVPMCIPCHGRFDAGRGLAPNAYLSPARAAATQRRTPRKLSPDPCTAPECTRTVGAGAQGLCMGHYVRLRRTGEVGGPLRQYGQ